MVIVGAGPAGSTAARLLAQGGLDVLLLEEHDAVGAPVHCTGIVGDELFQAFDVPRALIAAEVARFRVRSPGGDAFDLPRNTRSRAWALDRGALDRWLADGAVAAGARLELGAPVRAVIQEGDGVRLTVQRPDGTQEVRARVCVLACGAMSNLPRRAGILPPRTYYRTIQGSYAADGVPGAEIYLGSGIAAGSFGYVVATGPCAKIGVISRGSARHGYRRLLADARGCGRVLRATSPDVYRRIPMGACRRSVAGRVLAVGDAAGQTKTTTGGGIYYAMLCARMLADAVLAARRGANFQVGALGRYDAAWRRRIGLEIQAGLWLRGLFEAVPDESVDRLVRFASSDVVQEVFAREWDFDFHQGLLMALARLPEMRRQFLLTAASTVRARRLLHGIIQAVDPALSLKC